MNRTTKKPTPKPKEAKPRKQKPGPDSPYEIMFETRKLVRALGQSINPQIGQQLDRLIQQGEQIMSELADVKKAIADERAEVQAKLAALATEVQALKDQIASGTPVTSTDLDELITEIKDISEPSTPV